MMGTSSDKRDSAETSAGSATSPKPSARKPRRKAGGRQIPLDLPLRAARDRENFFVSQSNALALAQVDGWRAWPGLRLALVGPEGAGKTHLAAVWAQETGALRVAAADLAQAEPRDLIAAGALAIEDADRLKPLPGASGDAPSPAEAALFHLMNLAAEAQVPLLFTARAAPARWNVALPDLVTRLSALPVARIAPPDDRLLEALAVKLFADRQLAVGPDLPRYIVERAPRSHRGLARAVAEIDRAALGDRVRPTLRLAARVMDRLEAEDM